MKELKLKIILVYSMLYCKIFGAPKWLKSKIDFSAVVTPNFKLGQYFFSNEFIKELANKLERFESPCCLCTPSLGAYWFENGKTVTILDIDKRFDFAPGYMYFDLEKPVEVDQTFDVIIVDPIFVEPAVLLKAINTITKDNYNQKLMVVYPVRWENRLLEVFKEYQLSPSGYHPQHTYVTEEGRKKYQFYSNFKI